MPGSSPQGVHEMVCGEPIPLQAHRFQASTLRRNTKKKPLPARRRYVCPSACSSISIASHGPEEQIPTPWSLLARVPEKLLTDASTPISLLERLQSILVDHGSCEVSQLPATAWP